MATLSHQSFINLASESDAKISFAVTNHCQCVPIQITQTLHSFNEIDYKKTMKTTTIITASYVEALFALFSRFNPKEFQEVLVANDVYESDLFVMFGKSYSRNQPARNILIFDNELRFTFFLNEVYADSTRKNCSTTRVLAARRILTNAFARYGIVYTTV